METTSLISVSDYCEKLSLDITFIQTLHDFGLVHLAGEGSGLSIPFDELDRLEQMIRLHNDLQINLEGLQAVAHLLEKIQLLEQEICLLKNRLRMFEEP